MTLRRLAFYWLASILLLIGWLPAGAQSHARAKVAQDYSGMYSFLREGEFIQVNIDPDGKVTGFVSRYGDNESDRGVFLDHFFKQATLTSNQLSFTTDTVHGLAFEFHGSVERGEGKNPGDEAYYVLKGTLTENSMDDTKKTSSHTREVIFKIFPQELVPPQDDKK